MRSRFEPRTTHYERAGCRASASLTASVAQKHQLLRRKLQKRLRALDYLGGDQTVRSQCVKNRRDDCSPLHIDDRSSRGGFNRPQPPPDDLLIVDHERAPAKRSELPNAIPVGCRATRRTLVQRHSFHRSDRSPAAAGPTNNVAGQSRPGAGRFGANDIACAERRRRWRRRPRRLLDRAGDE